jgi:hypothetical protein
MYHKVSRVTAQELGLPEITPETAILNLPSWCNPGFTMAMFQATPTEVTLVANTNTQVAANNPKRWAIGFQDALVGTTQPRVSINTNPSVYGHIVDRTFANNWFTIFLYGPMVCMEWWAFSGAGGNFLLYELELQ